ncbi:chemotaxis protein CheW [bacterium]|nr:chemotaxis protein CheW [bacterium]
MQNNLRLLVFSQAGTRWAIPVVHAAEVIRHPRTFPLPSPGENTVGLVIYQETPVPAITLGEDVSVTYEYGIVVQAGERSVIILSHEQGSLQTVSSTELTRDEEPPEFIRYLWQSENEDDEPIRLIDARQLLGLRTVSLEKAR